MHWGVVCTKNPRALSPNWILPIIRTVHFLMEKEPTGKATAGQIEQSQTSIEMRRQLMSGQLTY
jgi:hypothetical protein